MRNIHVVYKIGKSERSVVKPLAFGSLRGSPRDIYFAVNTELLDVALFLRVGLVTTSLTEVGWLYRSLAIYKDRDGIGLTIGVSEQV